MGAAVFRVGDLLYKKPDITGPANYSFQDPSEPLEERVDKLIAQLTLEEKASLFSGKNMWHFKGIKRLGIPSIQVTDCGHGITVVPNKEGSNNGCATCFPTAVTQAASWDHELLSQIGIALAREARETGSTLLLAPMINLHRSPLGGRNYETFSEDPFLSGKLASAFIKGVQSQHIGACVKALIANNQQTNQSRLIAEIPQKALHEIYLRNFEIPVKEADPWALMTAYNGVNGKRSAENKDLNVGLLRNKWHYKGMVVSDWRSVQKRGSFQAGIDMEMPGPGKYMRQVDILSGLENSTITEEQMNEKLRGLCRLWIQSGLLDHPKPTFSSGLNTIAHQQLARRVSEESIVLLKNERQLLPFKKVGIKKLAIIGPNASVARLGGGGSASVTACYSVSPLEGIRKHCGDSIEVEFEQGCGLIGNLKTIPATYLQTPSGEPGLKAEFFNNKNLTGTPVTTGTDPFIDFSWGWAAPGEGINRGNYSVRWTGFLRPPVSGSYKIGLAISGAEVRLFINEKLLIDTWEGTDNENFENAFTSMLPQVEINLKKGTSYAIRVEWRKKINRNMVRLEWDLPGSGNAMEKAIKTAAKADAAVVFAGLSNFFEGGNNDKESLALPGDQNELIRKVVAANPNTVVVLINGTPVSMPWKDKIPAILEAYYPGQEGGNAIANILFGNVNPSGKLPETFPKSIEDSPSFGNFPGTGNKVFYKEGVFIGYRHYDARHIEPLFPFGHGLSYTQFQYSDLKITNKDNVIVQFTIKNTGEKKGKEVAQLYVRKAGGDEFKTLEGFEKVELDPQVSSEVSLVLDERAFSSFSVTQQKWIKDTGSFDLFIGSSSGDIRLKGMVRIS